MQCGIQDEAKKLGVTVNTQGPTKFDPTLQKPIVDSVVASKPDAILIAPTDVNAMQAPLDGGRGRHQDRAGRHHRQGPVHSRCPRSPPTTRAAARRRSTPSSS